MNVASANVVLAKHFYHLLFIRRRKSQPWLRMRIEKALSLSQFVADTVVARANPPFYAVVNIVNLGNESNQLQNGSEEASYF